MPIISKVFERLFLRRLEPTLDSNNVLPNYQFGFRKQHGTIEQIHRVVKTIRNSLEHKNYCTAAFLDVSQAFDKVWHVGLISKIKSIFPYPISSLLRSYLTDRFFQVKRGGEITNLFPICSGVPQGSILGPTLYLIYTSDLPTTINTTIATYADDTVIMASNPIATEASEVLQNHLTELESWLKLWRVQVNSLKSTQITFTLKKGVAPPVSINNTPLPVNTAVKYLGIHLDSKLNWGTHIWKKRLQLGLIYRKMYWYMSRKSNLSLENKIMIYKCILKPVWLYAAQIWGTASNTNIQKLQRFQSKVLRQICNAPWYVTNQRLHHDLQLPTVSEAISAVNSRYKTRLSCHPNPLATDLLNISHERRLKRPDPLDL